MLELVHEIKRCISKDKAPLLPASTNLQSVNVISYFSSDYLAVAVVYTL